jgi:hypothetical protein
MRSSLGKSNNRNLEGDSFLMVCFFCFERVNIVDSVDYDCSRPKRGGTRGSGTFEEEDAKFGALARLRVKVLC